MILTGSQVREKLKISKSVYARMIRDGELKPINTVKEGQKRLRGQFNSRDINAMVRGKRKPRKKPNGAAGPPIVGTARISTRRPTGLVRGVNTQLAELNAKMDMMLKQMAKLIVTWG